MGAADRRQPAYQLTHFSDPRPIADFRWSHEGERLAIVRASVSIQAAAAGAASMKVLTLFRIRGRFQRPVVVPGGFPSNTTPLDPRHHDIGPDGRIVVTLNVAGDEPTSAMVIHVVINWFEELKQKVSR